MSDTPKVDATHLKNALRDLGAKGAKAALKKVFGKYAREIRNKALPNVPESTGLLKQSLKVRLKFNRQGHLRAMVTAGSKVFDKSQQKSLGHKGAFYAGFQEYGFTDRGGKEHPGKHFLANALEALTPQIEESVAKEIEEEIKRRKNG